MSRALLACAAALLVAAAAAHGGHDHSHGEEAGAPSDALVILGDDSFDAKVGAGGTWLIKFYAPWCGHCKRLAPTWDQLATEVAAENAAAHVAKVDCTVHKSICERYEVRGYPTLLGFKDGATGSSTDAIKYPGGRDLASLKSWLTSNTPAAAAAAADL